MKKPSGKKVLSSCCYEPIKTTSDNKGSFFYFCPACGQKTYSNGTNPNQPVYHLGSERKRVKIMKEAKPNECNHSYRKRSGSNRIYCTICEKDFTESVESRDEKEGSSWEIDTIKNLEQRVEGLENTTKSLWSSLSLLNSIMKDLEQRIDELKEERLEQGSSIGELLQRIDNWEEMLNHLKEKHNEFGHVFEASTRNMWTEIGLLTERVEKLTKPIWKKKKS